MAQRRPVDVRIPADLREVTPAWVTEVLRASGDLADHAHVTAVQCTQIAVGVGFLSDLYRLELGGAGPSSLILKLPTTTAYRASGDHSDVYRREVAFYRDLAHLAPLRSPRAFAAAVDDTTGATVLVIEDLGRLEACDNLTGLPLSRMEAVIDALAGFHGWGATVAADVDHGLYPTVTDRWSSGVVDVVTMAGWPLYLQHRRREHPATVDRLVERLPSMAAPIAASMAEPAVVHHGDLRVDNLFFDGEQPVFVDFQFCARGSGVADVAYLLSQGVTAEARRGHERALVDRYADAAAAAGVAIDRSAAWRQFVDASTLLVFMPLGALLGWDVMGPRARDLVLTLVERWIDTMVDLGVVDLDTEEDRR